MDFPAYSYDPVNITLFRQYFSYYMCIKRIHKCINVEHQAMITIKVKYIYGQQYISAQLCKQ